MNHFPGLVKNSLFFGIQLFLLFGFVLPLRAYDAVTVVQGGGLYGTITLKGETPRNKSLEVTNTPEYCGQTVETETFIINPENNGIQNVVISIEDIGRGMKPHNVALVIENRHCHFVPHVQVGMAGDSYEIRNSDPVLHNTHLHMKDLTLMNVAMPANGKNIKRFFDKKGLVSLKCDAHKFMQGWIFISDNPYYAITDQDGKYSISDIPPGRYKVKIWHEGFSDQEEEITVFPDKKTNLSMDLGLQ